MPEDALQIKPMSMIHGFPPFSQFTADGSKKLMEELTIHMEKFNVHDLSIFCVRNLLSINSVDPIYGHNFGGVPTEENLRDGVVVEWNPTDSGGMLWSISFDLCLRDVNDEGEYYCTIQHGIEYIVSGMDVMLNTSYAPLPPGYDQGPEISVFHHQERNDDHPIEVYQVRCKRATTLPGWHSLKLLHNGREIRAEKMLHRSIQRGHRYDERHTLLLRNPTVDETGTYTCITETGRAVSDRVGPGASA